MNNRATIIQAFMLLLLLICSNNLFAQDWTRQDSLKLKQLLESEGEIKLNKEAVGKINFGNKIEGEPLISLEKEWLEPDATLPKVIQDAEPINPKQFLSLRPYNASTPCNWDPIYRKKIKMNVDTWRGNPLHHLTKLRSYTNWAKRNIDAGVRHSLEEIEASGQRYNPLAQRVNNQWVGAWQNTSVASGLDFNSALDFRNWDFKTKRRTKRTIEVLKQYGDSTTVNIREPIIIPNVY